MYLLFLFFLLSYCQTEHLQSDCGNGQTFNRDQAWRCAMNVVDTNHNKLIEGSEIDEAKGKYLYWYERALGFIAGPTKVENVMNDCDQDGDGKISRSDFDAKKLYCMPYMDPKKNWQEESNALCLVKTFCDRAAKVLGRNVY